MVDYAVNYIWNISDD